MGMFDSAYIICRCPNCGKEEERECQTKDTDCMLDVFRPGDFVSKQLRYLDCCATCDCGGKGKNKRVFFDLHIEIDIEGKLTDRYKIIEEE